MPISGSARTHGWARMTVPSSPAPWPGCPRVLDGDLGRPESRWKRLGRGRSAEPHLGPADRGEPQGLAAFL